MSPSRIATSSLPSFWRANPHKLDRHRSSEALPSKADIVIIGAGYTGISIAYHILSKLDLAQKVPSIVILEAREACSGATGRNGGHLKPDPYNRPFQVLNNHGKAQAEQLSQFESGNFAAVEEVVKRENIDCDFVRTLAYDVFFHQKDWDAALSKVKALRKAGVQSALDLNVSSSAEEAERTSRVKGTKGYISYATGHLAPYKLVTSLLEKLLTKGVNLQTFTPVSEIEKSGEEWLVSTPRGDIQAPTVIHASNGYAADLVPEMKDKIVPTRGICCRIVPKNPTQWSNHSYMLRHSDWAFDYLISRTDGSIIVGGARQQSYEQLDSWFDNSDDSTLIEQAKSYFDEYMQRTFHGWDDSGAPVEKIWTGIMGYSNDSCPYVGELPDKPGQYICAGFTGHGMPQVFLSAEAIAYMVTGGQSTSIPDIFRVTPERLNTSKEHATLKTWKAVTQGAYARL